ncbi:MAG: RNA polymerase sigma factor [Planctomycetota bacterium]
MATKQDNFENAGWTDGQLLTRFVAEGDHTVFSTLVIRHGPLVLGVCRRVLGDVHEAEDAFQATFLVLARSACKIRRHRSLACWLHGVAYRTASRVAKEKWHHMQPLSSDVIEDASQVLDHIAHRDQQHLVDEELSRLPATDRHALTLRYLEDLSNEEIAGALDISMAAVKGRLKRAKERLRRRLLRRGVSFGVFVAAVKESRVDVQAIQTLVSETIQLFMSGETTDVAASSAAHELALTEIGETVMNIRKILLLAASAILAATVSWHGLSKSGVAQEPQKAILVTSMAQQQPSGGEAPSATISPAIAKKPSGAESPGKTQPDEPDKRTGGNLITKVYQRRIADLERLREALEAVVPDAQVLVQRENKWLVVSASEKDHEIVEKIVDVAARRSLGETVIEVYSLDRLDSWTVARLLETIVPSAVVTPDRTRNELIVKAKPKVQEIIKEVLGGLGNLARMSNNEAEKDEKEAPADKRDLDLEQMTGDELRQHVSTLTRKVQELSQRMKKLEESLRFRIVPADND